MPHSLLYYQISDTADTPVLMYSAYCGKKGIHKSIHSTCIGTIRTFTLFKIVYSLDLYIHNVFTPLGRIFYHSRRIMC